MNLRKERRISALTSWAVKNPQFASLPFLQHRARDLYGVSGETAKEYANEVIQRLSNTKVIGYHPVVQHKPKFIKASQI